MINFLQLLKHIYFDCLGQFVQIDKIQNSNKIHQGLIFMSVSNAIVDINFHHGDEICSLY